MLVLCPDSFMPEKWPLYYVLKDMFQKERKKWSSTCLCLFYLSLCLSPRQRISCRRSARTTFNSSETFKQLIWIRISMEVYTYSSYTLYTVQYTVPSTNLAQPNAAQPFRWLYKSSAFDISVTDKCYGYCAVKHTSFDSAVACSARWCDIGDLIWKLPKQHEVVA